MTSSRWTIRAAALAAACGLAGACAPAQDTAGDSPTGGSTVQIGAHDYRFDPVELTASPGQAMRVELANRGERPHSIEFHLEGDKEAELPSEVQAGQSGSMTLTAPGKAGTYIYYCPVGDHRSRGMEGRLIVRAP